MKTKQIPVTMAVRSLKINDEKAESAPMIDCGASCGRSLSDRIEWWLASGVLRLDHRQ